MSLHQSWHSRGGGVCWFANIPSECVGDTKLFSETTTNRCDCYIKCEEQGLHCDIISLFPHSQIFILFIWNSFFSNQTWTFTKAWEHLSSMNRIKPGRKRKHTHSRAPYLGVFLDLFLRHSLFPARLHSRANDEPDRPTENKSRSVQQRTQTCSELLNPGNPRRLIICWVS